MRNLFGTDGIRGKANVFPMTPETALKVGKAVAQFFMKENGGRKHRIIIGKDTRLSGYMFENALSSGILSMGADVIFVGPMPTPAIAHLVRSMKCDAGIMLSASHNPAQDNGIKIFSDKGFKLSDTIEMNLEKIIEKDGFGNKAVTGNKIGMAKRIEDARGRYIEFLKNTIANNPLDGLKIVLDCANGAAYHIAPAVFSELGAEVISINCKPNGMNINDGCGAMYPEAVSKAVRENKADLGLSFDGDADRVLVVDEEGNTVDGNVLIAIVALYMKKHGKLKNDLVVVNEMANAAFLKLMEQEGIKAVVTPVGDRYIVDGVIKEGAVLGGEPNGHMLFFEHSTTDDGILAGLQLANILKQSGKKISSLASIFKPVPQILVNFKVKKKKPLEKMSKVQSAIASAGKELGTTGKVLVRYSGTEKIARVMVEGKDAVKIEKLANSIAREIKKEVGV